MGDISVPQSSRQLLLPLITLRDASSTDGGLPRSERIYANRNLPLTHIDWLGFDMDYTLAIYQQEAMDALSVEVTIDNLVSFGYPEYLRNLKYDSRFPIRGLHIDRQLGNVLKMDRFAAIHKGYHGFRRLDREEIRAAYWETKVVPDSERFRWIDTLFELSEVTSYVSIIEAMERRKERMDYPRLLEDIRRAIDLGHHNGTVHSRVLADLPRYVNRDPNLALTLHKLRSAGKKLFLLTNSPLPYTQRMMEYLLGESMPEYRSWELFFNVIIVAARKPLWFRGEEPFHYYHEGKPQPGVNDLERGVIYGGGNLKEFERLLGIRGARVLYVGDHIYGDIVRSKKESAWRTAMIIQELDAELAAHQGSAAHIRKKLELDEGRTRQEDELRFYQRRLKALHRHDEEPPDEAEERRIRRGLERVRATLGRMNEEQEQLEQTIDTSFHPYWGSLLKEQGELSNFGAQVERYADVYMPRVSCLQHYSAEQFFRSPHDFMPHEL
ncbi:MAG TPA: HAD-IG family 5'-nucleotidase [Polyangiaceae bacterium]|nr:HAD-IG family 5'-nucleotidase [Polyangiaceae bacterium]